MHGEIMEIVRDITSTGVILQKRIQCLKSGLQTIISCGDKMSSEDLVLIAKSTLEQFDKMP